jgi:site-specific recombinase
MVSIVHYVTRARNAGASVVTTTVGGAMLIILMIVLAPVGA